MASDVVNVIVTLSGHPVGQGDIFSHIRSHQGSSNDGDTDFEAKFAMRHSVRYAATSQEVHQMQ